MYLRNLTPYPHQAAMLLDAHARTILVVLVKVSCRLTDGTPHPEPLPVHVTDVRFPSGEVRYPGDLVPEKAGTDVVCNGHVYAPGGKPVTRCVAELRIGEMSREVVATGPRRTPDSEAEPFVRIPLGREHAPGLAALGPDAEERRVHCGTFDEKWRREQAPLLPMDMDVRFWNAAELTTARAIVGGEHLVLRNLAPSGVLETRLPRVAVRVRIDGRDLRSSLDRVLLEPDEDRVALTFRACADVTRRLDRQLPKVQIIEKRRVLLGQRGTR